MAETVDMQALYKKIQELEKQQEDEQIKNLRKALRGNAGRLDTIIDAYQNILKRKPAINEIRHHLFSMLPDKDIPKIIEASEEAKNINNRDKNGGVSYNMITDKFAIGETPKSDVLPKLKEQFQFFISLDDKQPLYLCLCESIHIPLNEIPLNHEKVIAACNVLNDQIKENKKVYMQCEVGGQKSAIIALFYMVKKENMSFQDAENKIKKARSLCILNMDLLTLDNIIKIYNDLK